MAHVISVTDLPDLETARQAAVAAQDALDAARQRQSAEALAARAAALSEQRLVDAEAMLSELRESIAEREAIIRASADAVEAHHRRAAAARAATEHSRTSAARARAATRVLEKELDSARRELQRVAEPLALRAQHTALLARAAGLSEDLSRALDAQRVATELVDEANAEVAALRSAHAWLTAQNAALFDGNRAMLQRG